MIYVHIPFCKSFCTYCDFYSEICSGAEAQRVQRFYECVRSEAAARRAELDSHVMCRCGSPDTLYIGGGTPSVLPLPILEGIVGTIGKNVFREFTLEVNPDDVTHEYALGLKALGVNRVSMGVQSFDDSLLKWMNRRHDSAAAVEAFRILREAGFGNISIDLIFGISHLSDQMWLETVRKAVDLRPEHISAYQLSVEEGSALAGMVSSGRYSEATQEQCRSQYDLLCRELAAAGYEHYEISNWALPGRAALHNSGYWTRSPYIGLGPGAHSLSLDGRTRSWNSHEPEGWTVESETLSEGEVAEETVMLGLRRSEGLPEACLKSRCPEGVISSMLEEGSLESLPGGRFRIPEDRFFVSDGIISAII